MLTALAKLFGLSKPKAEEVKVEEAPAAKTPAAPAKIKATRKPRQKKTTAK